MRVVQKKTKIGLQVGNPLLAWYLFCNNKLAFPLLSGAEKQITFFYSPNPPSLSS